MLQPGARSSASCRYTHTQREREINRQTNRMMAISTAAAAAAFRCVWRYTLQVRLGCSGRQRNDVNDAAASKHQIASAECFRCLVSLRPVVLLFVATIPLLTYSEAYSSVRRYK